MRIGILSFINSAVTYPADTSALLDFLKQENPDHDLITADEPVSSPRRARQEAERIARADCEAVILLLGAGAAPALATEAALFVNCPLLLCGEGTALPALLDASGALDEIGIAHERVIGPVSVPEIQEQIARWLRENGRAVRQRGEDAAQKLYGTRFAVYGSALLPGVDTAHWLHRFGITIVPGDLAAIAERASALSDERVDAARTAAASGGDAREIRRYLALRDELLEHEIGFCTLPEDADWHLTAALLGDTADSEGEKRIIACTFADAPGALTAHLLTLVSGGPVLTAHIAAVDHETGLTTLNTVVAPPSLTQKLTGPATFTRITRRAGRFVATVFPGEFTGATEARFACGSRAFALSAASRTLHAAPGDHTGALAAAFAALDIDTRVMR